MHLRQSSSNSIDNKQDLLRAQGLDEQVANSRHNKCHDCIEHLIKEQRLVQVSAANKVDQNDVFESGIASQAEREQDHAHDEHPCILGEGEGDLRSEENQCPREL